MSKRTMNDIEDSGIFSPLSLKANANWKRIAAYIFKDDKKMNLKTFLSPVAS